jgi:hypothetical protein
MMQGSHGSVDEYSNLLHCAISATKQLQLSWDYGNYLPVDTA